MSKYINEITEYFENGGQPIGVFAMAKKLGCSHQHVWQSFKVLTAKGYLERELDTQLIPVKHIYKLKK
jgi:Mn-dependent DtxR family transcriptional regulator